MSENTDRILLIIARLLVAWFWYQLTRESGAATINPADRMRRSLDDADSALREPF